VNPTTIDLSTQLPSNDSFKLSQNQDYILECSSNPVTQGIQLQEPGTTTVVMRDLLIGSAAAPLSGSYKTNHAECVQTWSGPARLLIDGLQCFTTYQGLRQRRG
jgi:hypothetical protein